MVGVGFLPGGSVYYYLNDSEPARFFDLKTGKEVSPIKKK